MESGAGIVYNDEVFDQHRRGGRLDRRVRVWNTESEFPGVILLAGKGRRGKSVPGLCSYGDSGGSPAQWNINKKYNHIMSSNFTLCKTGQTETNNQSDGTGENDEDDFDGCWNGRCGWQRQRRYARFGDIVGELDEIDTAWVRKRNRTHPTVLDDFAVMAENGMQ
jgi:hypothetical protein